MNYYNPYYYMMSPSMFNYPMTSAASPGLFSRLTNGIRGIGWADLLNNTQRTLGIINQAIPLVKQATPMLHNARTMFQVMNEFKKIDTPDSPSPIPEKQKEEHKKETVNEITSSPPTYQNGPTFFQ